MKKINVLLLAFLLLSFWANAQQYPFNGLDMNMGNLSRLSNAQSRSISPENFTGEKGKGAMADPVRDKDVRNKANATFILPQEEWFAAQSQRFFTFVVQEGGGPDNYQIWSSGRTVEAGKVVKIEIRLTQFPN